MTDDHWIDAGEEKKGNVDTDDIGNRLDFFLRTDKSILLVGEKYEVATGTIHDLRAKLERIITHLELAIEADAVKNGGKATTGGMLSGVVEKHVSPPHNAKPARTYDFDLEVLVFTDKWTKCIEAHLKDATLASGAKMICDNERKKKRGEGDKVEEYDEGFDEAAFWLGLDEM